MPKKLSAFETAFAGARKKGKSKFIFQGKSYTTELAKPKKKGAMKKNQGFNIKKGKINAPVLKKAQQVADKLKKSGLQQFQ